MKRYLPLLANLAAGTIFGFAMLFIKTGMAVVNQDSVKFLAFRFTIGFIAMTIIRFVKYPNMSYKGRPVKWILICGFFNPMISQVLETTSTTYAPTAQIAVFMSLIPIMVIVMSVLINREYPTRRQVFFLIFTVSGVVLINLVGGQMVGGTTLGLLLILGCIVAVSLNRVYIRKASIHFNAFETIYITTGMGSLWFCTLTFTMHAVRGDLGSFFTGLWTPNFIIPILYMGIGSCVIAFLCQTYAAGHLPIAVSSATGSLNTVISILVGVFLLGETFRPIDVVGTVVIISGIIGMSLSYNTRVSNKLENVSRDAQPTAEFFSGAEGVSPENPGTESEEEQ